VFATRESVSGAAGVVELAFTDRHGGVSPPPFDSLDLSRLRDGDGTLRKNFQLLATAFDVEGFATMRQVQGADVAVVTEVDDEQPVADGLVTAHADVALCVRVGDCVPVILADPDAGVVAVAHAGRAGVVAGVVPATVRSMRSLGAERITGWIGPHVCGACYEVPAPLRQEVAAVVPTAFACTTNGTPAADLGAAVEWQLTSEGCAVRHRSVCTLESSDFFSYRRNGSESGRSAGIVVRRAAAGAATSQ
jgi:polyphenol oxidase